MECVTDVTIHMQLDDMLYGCFRRRLYCLSPYPYKTYGQLIKLIFFAECPNGHPYFIDDVSIIFF